ncbi:cation:proton antiporter [Pendulispora rubella]|uniref:Cation:proton antiporter n=1 Tax=Pendulispora rubella TaxID=2741070 RepID=A0ABZ2L151_9BACT
MDRLGGVLAGHWKSAFAYTAMLGGSLGAFHLICKRGEMLTAAPPVSGQALLASVATKTAGHPLLHVLIALVAIIIAAGLVGTVFRYLGQPPVIGEVIAGIMLGPSLLGRVAPSAQQMLFPAEITPLLGILSQIGVVLFMFIVGVEFDTGALKKRGHTSVAISHASIVTPFVLGTLLALVLYPKFSSSDVPFAHFALFMGVSMSITAFPVLARILRDRQLQSTKLGVVALTCAAVDDVTAWCLLALIVTIARRSGVSQAAMTFALSGAFIAFMMVAGRPALRWLAMKHEESRDGFSYKTMAIVLVALLVSAIATEAIGVHALFGAFVFGAFIPSHSKLAKDMETQISGLVRVLLLPAFFAFTGLRTQIGLIDTTTQWLFCGGIVAVAVLGKFGGSFGAAALTGLGWRDAAAIGALMNTRGLMELVVLNLGLDLQVISPTIYAMMVIMALVTTFMTAPVLTLLRWTEDRREATALISHAEPTRE